MRVDEWYASLSGASMFNPMCCGVAAQILRHDPALTPDEAKKLLMISAVGLDNYDQNTQGAGVVDAQRAGQELGDSAGVDDGAGGEWVEVGHG